MEAPWSERVIWESKQESGVSDQGVDFVLVMGIKERPEDNDEITAGIESGRTRAGDQEESMALRGMFGRDPFRSLQVPFIFFRKPPPEPLLGVYRPEVILHFMNVAFCTDRCVGKHRRKGYCQDAVKGEARRVPALDRDVNQCKEVRIILEHC